ncbi:DUF4188 domain-containing protein [Granulicella sp. S156]|uniref:DUF4188 domain-containing protein n=1 Tax=Granulicella sp. S156 TaxID=1747224 RepID=UPI00131B2DB8|nr:DUF4188 domain-containing protein [Granulicella sp. S156]
MVSVHKGRYAAQIEGDFVVFMIGMRFNRIFLIHKWLPVVLAMPRMLKELFQHPELGMLDARTFVSGRTLMVVQYWRSFEHLHAYAHARDKEHLPAWAEFNRRIGGNGALGIFHESYLVPAGGYECVYANMPRFGLAKAGEMVPAVGRLETAKSRLGERPVKATSDDSKEHP